MCSDWFKVELGAAIFIFDLGCEALEGHHSRTGTPHRIQGSFHLPVSLRKQDSKIQAKLTYSHLNPGAVHYLWFGTTLVRFERAKNYATGGSYDKEMIKVM